MMFCAIAIDCEKPMGEGTSASVSTMELLILVECFLV